MTRQSILGIFLLCLQLAAVTAQEFTPYRKPAPKLIEFSWSSPRPAFLQANLATIEQDTPYDGLGIIFDGMAADGSAIDSRMIFRRDKLEADAFAAAAATMKSIRFTRLTDNFLMTGVMPGNVDFFSDGDWESVCHNIRLLAGIARECGLRGLQLDTEMYGEQLFRYHSNPEHTLAETAEKARQRGYEFGRAMFDAYPDMVLFTFFFISVRYHGDFNFFDGADGLLNAFYYGLVEAMPPGVQIVDGREGDGYYANSEEDYRAMRQEFLDCIGLRLDRNDRNKFLTNIKHGPGTYLDAYLIRRRYNEHYNAIDPNEHNITKRVAMLRKNLYMALDSADEYAWTWGEYCSWWPWALGDNVKEDGGGIRWEERAPGVTEAVTFARRPLETARAMIEAQPERFRNLTTNGNFATGNANGWGLFSDDPAQEFAVVPNAGINGSAGAVFQHLDRGIFIQEFPVTPGNFHYVRARGRLEGRGEVHVLVRQKSNGNWLRASGGSDWQFAFAGPADSWQTADGVMLMSDKTDQVMLLISFADMEEGTFTLDDVAFFDLEPIR